QRHLSTPRKGCKDTPTPWTGFQSSIAPRQSGCRNQDDTLSDCSRRDTSNATIAGTAVTAILPSNRASENLSRVCDVLHHVNGIHVHAPPHLGRPGPKVSVSFSRRDSKHVSINFYRICPSLPTGRMLRTL
ncbi:unnamed protein product, partial [Ectocarpus sp. 8 AP-2014]